jgi:integrase
MSAMEQLPPEDANVVVVHMLTPSSAVDLYLGDLARHSRSQDGRTVVSYRRILDKFTDHLGNQKDVTEITSDDCRRFLDTYARGVKGKPHKPGTQANTYAIVNGFLSWLYMQQRIRKNPLDHIPRPRRMNPEDLDVVTTSTADVRKMLAVCQTWTEKLAVGIPAYMGPRRHAIAQLRLRDYDQAAGKITFREKGGKVIRKPIPDGLRRLLDSAIADGAIVEPDDYLVPPEGPLARKGARDDRVIWRVVKRIGDRSGVPVHVHALRAAFAVFYLEGRIGDLQGLKELMGHESIATTQTYLRKLDREVAMERVRGLSWGVDEIENMDAALLSQVAAKRNQSSTYMGVGGFEPPNTDNPHGYKAGTQPGPKS